MAQPVEELGARVVARFVHQQQRERAPLVLPVVGGAVELAEFDVRAATPGQEEVEL